MDGTDYPYIYGPKNDATRSVRPSSANKKPFLVRSSRSLVVEPSSALAAAAKAEVDTVLTQATSLNTSRGRRGSISSLGGSMSTEFSHAVRPLSAGPQKPSDPPTFTAPLNEFIDPSGHALKQQLQYRSDGTIKVINRREYSPTRRSRSASVNQSFCSDDISSSDSRLIMKPPNVFHGPGNSTTRGFGDPPPMPQLGKAAKAQLVRTFSSSSQNATSDFDGRLSQLSPSKSRPTTPGRAINTQPLTPSASVRPPQPQPQFQPSQFSSSQPSSFSTSQVQQSSQPLANFSTPGLKRVPSSTQNETRSTVNIAQVYTALDPTIRDRYKFDHTLTWKELPGPQFTSAGIVRAQFHKDRWLDIVKQRVLSLTFPKDDLDEVLMRAPDSVLGQLAAQVKTLRNLEAKGRLALSLLRELREIYNSIARDSDTCVAELSGLQAQERRMEEQLTHLTHENKEARALVDSIINDHHSSTGGIQKLREEIAEERDKFSPIVQELQERIRASERLVENFKFEQEQLRLGAIKEVRSKEHSAKSLQNTLHSLNAENADLEQALQDIQQRLSEQKSHVSQTFQNRKKKLLQKSTNFTGNGGVGSGNSAPMITPTAGGAGGAEQTPMITPTMSGGGGGARSNVSSFVGQQSRGGEGDSSMMLGGPPLSLSGLSDLPTSTRLPQPQQNQQQQQIRDQGQQGQSSIGNFSAPNSASASASDPSALLMSQVLANLSHQQKQNSGVLDPKTLESLLVETIKQALGQQQQQKSSDSVFKEDYGDAENRTQEMLRSRAISSSYEDLSRFSTSGTPSSELAPPPPPPPPPAVETTDNEVSDLMHESGSGVGRTLTAIPTTPFPDSQPEPPHLTMMMMMAVGGAPGLPPRPAIPSSAAKRSLLHRRDIESDQNRNESPLCIIPTTPIPPPPLPLPIDSQSPPRSETPLAPQQEDQGDHHHQHSSDLEREQERNSNIPHFHDTPTSIRLIEARAQHMSPMFDLPFKQPICHHNTTSLSKRALFNQLERDTPTPTNFFNTHDQDQDQEDQISSEEEEERDRENGQNGDGESGDGVEHGVDDGLLGLPEGEDKAGSIRDPIDDLEAARRMTTELQKTANQKLANMRLMSSLTSGVVPLNNNGSLPQPSDPEQAFPPLTRSGSKKSRILAAEDGVYDFSTSTQPQPSTVSFERVPSGSQEEDGVDSPIIDDLRCPTAESGSGSQQQQQNSDSPGGAGGAGNVWNQESMRMSFESEGSQQNAQQSPLFAPISNEENDDEYFESEPLEDFTLPPSFAQKSETPKSVDSVELSLPSNVLPPLAPAKQQQLQPPPPAVTTTDFNQPPLSRKNSSMSTWSISESESSVQTSPLSAGGKQGVVGSSLQSNSVVDVVSKIQKELESSEQDLPVDLNAILSDPTTKAAFSAFMSTFLKSVEKGASSS